MALIVEDGTGLANAQSYVTVAEADAYFKARGISAWDDLDANDDKIPALIRATDYLDAYYVGRWAGQLLVESQALAWPRAYVAKPVPEYPPTGWDPYYASAPLPAALKRATFELALKQAQSPSTPLLKDSAQAVKQKTVGPITVIYQDGSSASEADYANIDALLTGLLGASASGTVRFVRG